MSWDDDAWYYEREAAMEAFLEESLKNIAEDNIRGYLGQNGDAINLRVEDCLRQARELKDLDYFQPAVTLATTAIEIIVRFMLIRPLLQGAFLSDDWAQFISRRIVSGRSAEDRALLPSILSFHGIELGSIKLPDEKLLWETIVKEVYPKRHRVIHAAAPASSEEAELAIKCAETLSAEIVRPIAKKLGFSLEETGRWSQIKGEKGVPGEDGYQSWAQSFVTNDPFD